ncbi:MAG: SDR family NAD(P)-dependent oxidoreductase, partial [Lysobacter sp.]|nr:SDR family NAD(P)-dependent oxidoreductase [Lysobacter sp.]
MTSATSPAIADDDLLARLRAAAELLERIGDDHSLLATLPTPDRERLQRAVARVYHPDPVARRQRLKAAERERNAASARREDELLEATGIRELRRKPVFTTPNYFPPQGFQPADRDFDEPFRGETVEPQHCYVCKQKYSKIHHFYDQLCPDCASFNYAKRTELADLTGRVALLTGGRVKIGYQAGLKLLRAGAELIVTTRFPRDSAARYAQEPDFGAWGHRLQVFGLDLRHTPSVEAFCSRLLATRERLDFIINNACQTVRRPPEFYAHMMQGETAALADTPQVVRQLLGHYEVLRGAQASGEGDAALARIDADRAADAPGLTRAAELSQIALLPDELVAQRHLFPEGRLDQDLQQVDLRGRNSWRLLMDEVPSVELLEVQLVNAVAPFIINARLKPLMLRTGNRDKHIVNVSAVEGQFYRNFKTTRHPHTNMA